MSNLIALIFGMAVMAFFVWLLLVTAGGMHDVFVLGIIVVGVLILVGLVRPPRRRVSK